MPVRALDHDYKPDGKATPVGLLLPEHDELTIAVCTSKVTSDCIVDTYDAWWVENKSRFPKVDTLVFLQDNGPENSGRRSQFLHRMVQFVEQCTAPRSGRDVVPQLARGVIADAPAGASS